LENKAFTWYPLVVAVFVTALIISNIIAVKLIDVFGVILPAAVVLFPLSYIIGDVLTEVYGFSRARQAIWTGFACNLLAVIAIWVAGALPAASFWSVGSFKGAETAQQAYQAILGFTPRLLLASFLAYLAGEFLNAAVLAKLKVKTSGRYLWLRTISSTIVGQGADSLVFITVAFSGILPTSALQAAILSQWAFKTSYEVLATPLTYLMVNLLKRAEGVDFFDRGTKFSPL
jgi:uncharacterized integral membrane protein (TIGR00697 family)